MSASQVSYVSFAPHGPLGWAAPDFPFHPQKEMSSETVGEGSFWAHLPEGPVGEILGSYTVIPNQSPQWYFFINLIFRDPQ